MWASSIAMYMLIDSSAIERLYTRFLAYFIQLDVEAHVRTADSNTPFCGLKLYTHTCRADNCETEDIICRPVVVSVEVCMNNCYMFSVLYANHDIYVHVQFQTQFAICVQVLCHHWEVSHHCMPLHICGYQDENSLRNDKIVCRSNLFCWCD